MFSSIVLVLVSMLALAQPPLQVVQGRVLTADGQPVSGAVVAVVPIPNAADAQVARTASDGRFRLMAPTGKAGLTATASGCLPHFRAIEVAAGAPPESLDLKLEPGGHRVAGTVIPAPGKDLVGLRLGFTKFSQDEGDIFFTEASEGRFAVTLAPGDYLVSAGVKGQRMPGKKLSVPGDGAPLELRLELEPSPAGPEVRAWIRQTAIPLTTAEAGHDLADMAPVASIVGSARVVALGEATHGTREFFQLKHRMLEFLAEKMGFTVFAIEANLPEAFAVNEYVLTGKGDPAQALAGLYFWTWNTEEVLEMIRWMRRYNESPAHVRKLKFYGVDMQTPTVAYAQAKEYLGRVDADAAETMQRTLGPIAVSGSRASTDRAVATAWHEAVVSLLARIDARRAELVTAAGSDAFERQRQNLVILLQYARMRADAEGGYSVRDEAMAANVRWILEQEKGARIVLWAHNGHVSFRGGAMAGENPMGWHLRQTLGRDYVVFGFAFSRGGFQAIDFGAGKRGLVPFEVEPLPTLTLNEALASAGQPILALNLRALPATGSVRSWFDAPQSAWAIGSAFNTERAASYVQSTPPTSEYDALLYVDKTTRARPNPSGRRTSATLPVSTPTAKALLNLDFEEGDLGKPPAGWRAPSSAAYAPEITNEGAKAGATCLEVSHRAGGTETAYTLMQAVDAAAYRGKRIRVTGWVRTDGQPGVSAALWVRVDRDGGQGFFDNMTGRRVAGTAWTEAVIAGVVDADARALNLGCMVLGPGAAWFDAIRIDVLSQ